MSILCHTDGGDTCSLSQKNGCLMTAALLSSLYTFFAENF